MTDNNIPTSTDDEPEGFDLDDIKDASARQNIELAIVALLAPLEQYRRKQVLEMARHALGIPDPPQSRGIFGY